MLWFILESYGGCKILTHFKISTPKTQCLGIRLHALPCVKNMYVYMHIQTSAVAACDTNGRHCSSNSEGECDLRHFEVLPLNCSCLPLCPSALYLSLSTLDHHAHKEGLIFTSMQSGRVKAEVFQTNKTVEITLLTFHLTLLTPSPGKASRAWIR